jgi:glucose-1-phosphate cytidylyltransferase
MCLNTWDGNMENIMWEDEPLEKLALDGQLAAYRHKGFWKCMDALRDKIELESLWQISRQNGKFGKAPAIAFYL